jgi:hypothetical protein
VTEGVLKAVLAVVAVYHLVSGGMALLAPDQFFDVVGTYGIENSHYVGDVGAFTFAFGVAAGIAVARPAWRAPILWLGALGAAWLARVSERLAPARLPEERT